MPVCFSLPIFIRCFSLFYTEYAEKVMHKLYKQRLVRLAKANSFYVLSTSFLRNCQYEAYRVHILYIHGLICRAVCLYQKNVVTLHTFN